MYASSKHICSEEIYCDIINHFSDPFLCSFFIHVLLLISLFYISAVLLLTINLAFDMVSVLLLYVENSILQKNMII